MLDRRRDGFPALWGHRPAGVADGFHEPCRRLVADRTVRPTGVILMFERLAFYPSVSQRQEPVLNCPRFAGGHLG